MFTAEEPKKMTYGFSAAVVFFFISALTLAPWIRSTFGLTGIAGIIAIIPVLILSTIVYALVEKHGGATYMESPNTRELNPRKKIRTHGIGSTVKKEEDSGK